MTQKKVYFSEFEDYPSWCIENGKHIIIDYDGHFAAFGSDSPLCEDSNIIYDSSIHKVGKRKDIEKAKKEKEERDKI